MGMSVISDEFKRNSRRETATDDFLDMTILYNNWNEIEVAS
jgi:hypothetical protein